jgi:protein-S-isoprenylcysteine O-methyltransferase Ste14
MEQGSNVQTQSALTRSTIRKAVAGLIVITLLPAAIIFIAAGRVDWWEAWLLIVILALAMIASRVIMFRTHPELAMERARWTQDRNTKDWDKRLMPIAALYGPALMWLVAGLDKRWNGSPSLAIELELAAFVVVILGYLISIWAFLENKFFSAVVRIQTERGHSVVSTGPYRWVRHPGYAGGLIGYLATPFALGTLWSFLPAVLTGIALIARTALEDQTLQNELTGYREYAARVRYRLLPGVW